MAHTTVRREQVVRWNLKAYEKMFGIDYEKNPIQKGKNVVTALSIRVHAAERTGKLSTQNREIVLIDAARTRLIKRRAFSRISGLD